MKKLILIALAFAGLSASAGVTLGVKPIFEEPKCYGGQNGKISVIVEGGVSPYYYHWSTDAPGHYGSATLANLTSGTYEVTVYDNNGDSGTYTVNLGQPNALNLYTSGQNVTVHGGDNGAIGILVDGGTPNYEFLWSNNATTQDIYNLQAGTYTVTVTDGFGCTSVASQTISQPNNLQQGHLPELPGGMQDVKGLAPKTGSGNTKMESLSGTDEVGANTNTVAMFPNPASDFVNLNMTDSKNAQVTFYNGAGQVVMQKMAEGNENRLDISSLAKGDYIVAISSDNGTTTKTISVIK